MQDLIDNVKNSLAPFTQHHFYIGYSGGIDSHVLLHCCSQLAEFNKKMTAVYINHQLQAISDDWAIHCEKMAFDLNINFLALNVNALPKNGESPEEAARNARYQALKNLIKRDCVLLIAQHREDQLETVLLQLFRGCGLRGLAGMPEKAAFGEGCLLRPFLDISKNEIINYAKVNQLQWVEDPTNQSDDYDRNFLRNQIIPQLKQRWQALDKTVFRTAKHCANADEMLKNMAKQWFQSVVNSDNTIDLQKLRFYDSMQQDCILREWFFSFGLKMPSQKRLNQIFAEIMNAKNSSSAVLYEQQHEIRCYQNTLFCLKKSQKETFKEKIWDKNQDVLFFSSDWVLSIHASKKGILKTVWENAQIRVRTRKGGEKIELPFRKGHHDLKKLYQEAKIPPWKRESIPLIYLNNELAAVGSFWINRAFYNESEHADCIFVNNVR